LQLGLAWILTWLSILPLSIQPAFGQTPNKTASQHVAFSLDELQRRTFGYFWQLADPQTGLIPDRYPTRSFSSIAATGFGLAAYVVGVDRGYVTRDEAARRARATLEFLWQLPQGKAPAGVAGHRGFFYHFLHMDSGLRYRQVELSTIDTALLLAGVLTCQTFFDGDTDDESQIRQRADQLYRRVEWDWFIRPSGRLSMGWHPERGFLPAEWKGYNEAMILYLLALGSPTHPIPPSSWQRWTETYQWRTYYDQAHVNFSPLFGHQYSHMFVDFRGIQDAYMREKGIDYFENSRRATLSQRAYARDNPQGFRGYSADIWGLTACDGPENATRSWKTGPLRVHTYWARGASALAVRDDGTLAPTAVGGSVPFAPEICLPTLRKLWEEYEPLVGEFGFRDAFNLSLGFDPNTEPGWFDIDYLGIDQGPILIQIANYQDGVIWDLMKHNDYLLQGLLRAGFRSGWLDASAASSQDQDRDSFRLRRPE
jgi:hypothetical protein